jgi:predicted RND superfamily exporter protein
VTGPVETITAVAAENETVAGMVEDADTDGDGVPDRNLDEIYDAVYDADPAAASATIHRDGGEYRSLRLSVALSGTTNTRVITEEMRAIANEMEAQRPLDVVATGSPIITELVQRSLLRTLVEGFLITFAVILAFLTLIFRLRYGSAVLGAVVLFPVVLAQAWLFGTMVSVYPHREGSQSPETPENKGQNSIYKLGASKSLFCLAISGGKHIRTMYLAGLAFTTETAIIAAIGIGIGVDYAIHIGERFMEARGRPRTHRGTLPNRPRDRRRVARQCGHDGCWLRCVDARAGPVAATVRLHHGRRD